MALLPSFERLDGSFVMQRLLGYSVVVQPDEAVQRLLQIVRAGRTLTTGGAAKNLDWLSSDPQAPAVLDGTAEAE